MEVVRKPFQGVGNILRFNRHMFLVAFLAIAALFTTGIIIGGGWRYMLQWLSLFLLLTVITSLFVSWHVYDRSALYDLRWLDPWFRQPPQSIVTVHAGFDESSALLAHKFPAAEIFALDFYDPLKHTERSIALARRHNVPFPRTIAISTDAVPLHPNSIDCIVAFLSAHEIRDDAERVRFFRQLARALHPGGQLIVVEHLRDLPNFLAYNIGFLHFLSERTWRRTFNAAGLQWKESKKHTAFITAFRLQPHANPH